MADTHVALKDGNSVASAIFESSTSAGVILRGQIDPATGRILVTTSGGGSGGTGTWYSVSGTIDGVNTTFTIAVSPASDILLFLARQPQMKTTDFTLSGSTITYVTAPDASLSGFPHQAFVIS